MLQLKKFTDIPVSTREEARGSRPHPGEPRFCLLYNRFILCHHLLLLLSIFLSIKAFLVSRLFVSGGQSIGASASFLPMNIQGRFSLGLTGYTPIQNQKLKNYKAWQPRASRTEGQSPLGQHPTVESSGSSQPPQQMRTSCPVLCFLFKYFFLHQKHIAGE